MSFTRCFGDPNKSKEFQTQEQNTGRSQKMIVPFCNARAAVRWHSRFQAGISPQRQALCIYSVSQNVSEHLLYAKHTQETSVDKAGIVSAPMQFVTKMQTVEQNCEGTNPRVFHSGAISNWQIIYIFIYHL